MNNVLAIAHKELRAYFASPIAYIVIGFFALLFGWFYIGILDWFVRQGLQGQMGMGAGSMNVNQQMIRPLILNVTVVFLFLLPLITMRIYAEEKRSGTIELLLTSPLTDLEIVLGKFLGALALYAVMVALTLIHFGLLFAFGNPEWKPLATAYLGLLLFGGCFISLGLFISSLTKNQIVAGAATFGVFLLLWMIDWIGEDLGPDRTGDHQIPVDDRSSRRLRERRDRHQAPCVLPELHCIWFVPDGAIGRHRAVAGIGHVESHCWNRRLDWNGPRGGAVAIRLFRPEYAQYGYWLAWAGLACVVLYMLGQWRDVATAMGRKQTRLSTIALAGVLIVLGLLVAVNYLASRRNHRWDLTANQQFSLSPQTRQILEKLDAPVIVLVFDAPASSIGFAIGLVIPVRLEQGVGRISRSGQAAGSREPEPGAVVRHRRVRLQGPHRTCHLVRRAGTDEWSDQGDHGNGAKGLFPPGPRRKGNDRQRAGGLQRRRVVAGIREFQGRDAVAGAAADGAG